MVTIWNDWQLVKTRRDLCLCHDVMCHDVMCHDEISTVATV